MDEKKIEAILNHYSPQAQTIKAIEELAELQTELARDLNGQGDVYDIMTELADVVIMIAQLMYIYKVDPKDLDKEIAFKLERQVKRIEENKSTKSAVASKDEEDVIKRSNALQALVDCDYIKGYAYTQMEEALMAIPAENKEPAGHPLKDCTWCMGAAFGDCEDCKA